MLSPGAGAIAPMLLSFGPPFAGAALTALTAPGPDGSVAVSLACRDPPEVEQNKEKAARAARRQGGYGAAAYVTRAGRRQGGDGDGDGPPARSGARPPR